MGFSFNGILQITDYPGEIQKRGETTLDLRPFLQVLLPGTINK